MRCRPSTPALRTRCSPEIDRQQRHLGVRSRTTESPSTGSDQGLESSCGRGGSCSEGLVTARNVSCDHLLLERVARSRQGRRAAWVLDGEDRGQHRIPEDALPAPSRSITTGGIGGTGALLVRPDEDVAWRAGGVAQALGLGQALGVVTGRRLRAPRSMTWRCPVNAWVRCAA